MLAEKLVPCGIGGKQGISFVFPCGVKNSSINFWIKDAKNVSLEFSFDFKAYLMYEFVVVDDGRLVLFNR